MFVPFNTLPPEARVWVYQSNRPFQPEEERWLEQRMADFCQQWQAHQVPLNASFQIAFHQFVVLAVNEAPQAASGCSIDSSVHALKQFQHHLGVDFFDRQQAAFLVNNQVVLYALPDVPRQLQTGGLSPADLYFNNLVADKAAWSTQWLQPIEHSWMKRFLLKPAHA